jgi:hypothetical protein
VLKCLLLPPHYQLLQDKCDELVYEEVCENKAEAEEGRKSSF